jgi:FkbM family methyltransferase
MTAFYSQNGEDFLLSEIFRGRETGFFVEVGCIDGRRFSNTLCLEEMGWRGLCVEAHAGYIELIGKNRPGAIVCHAAVADADEDEAVFYANARGSLSTLDGSREEEFRRRFGAYFTGFEEQRVRKRRLDSILRGLGIKEMDLLSLDIEGGEIEALCGLDLGAFRPTVMVVESDAPAHTKALDAMTGAAGYLKAAVLAHNVFYVLDPEAASRVSGKVFRGVTLTHTAHPLDAPGDATVVVDIDTRGGTALRRAARRLCGRLMGPR